VVVGQIRCRVLVTDQVRHSGESEIEVVGPIDSVWKMFVGAESGEHGKRFVDRFAQFLAPVQKEAVEAARSGIENDSRDMVIKFSAVGPDVARRSEHAVLFAGEEDEAQCAPRPRVGGNKPRRASISITAFTPSSSAPVPRSQERGIYNSVRAISQDGLDQTLTI
jgi:hypothetical protein